MSSIISWNEDRFEVFDNKACLDEHDLIFGLAKAGFFSSSEVRGALSYKRKNRYVIDNRIGMSGCKDWRLYELRKGEVLRESFTHKILRARIHLSMASKFNEGIRCSLVDFVTISFKEWGWDKFYLNPEWIEENVCAYIQEAQYSTIAHSSYAEGIKERDLGKWLSLLKEGRGSWWYNVRVSPISSYQGNFELEGSLLDSNSEAPTPEILLTKEVERIERLHRFFCNTTWEKMYVDESPDCKDTSAWYVERCKASLREEDPETDLEEFQDTEYGRLKLQEYALMKSVDDMYENHSEYDEEEFAELMLERQAEVFSFFRKYSGIEKPAPRVINIHYIGYVEALERNNVYAVVDTDKGTSASFSPTSKLYLIIKKYGKDCKPEVLGVLDEFAHYCTVSDYIDRYVTLGKNEEIDLSCRKSHDERSNGQRADGGVNSPYAIAERALAEQERRLAWLLEESGNARLISRAKLAVAKTQTKLSHLPKPKADVIAKHIIGYEEFAERNKMTITRY